ncbi:MAG: hypothetical protein R6U15_08130 [Candidatus Izemoplasmatales bacterium]
MNYKQRQYLIFSTDQLHKVDFTQVLETSQDTVRKSVDKTKTFIKWEDEQPDFISTLTNTEGPYNHSEMLQVLNSEEWEEETE